jgi:hypothetical protein
MSLGSSSSGRIATKTACREGCGSVRCALLRRPQLWTSVAKVYTSELFRSDKVLQIVLRWFICNAIVPKYSV